MMEVSAKLKCVAISPQKCRLVANLIRGQSVESALDYLKLSTKKAAVIVGKLLESAIANAEHNKGLDVDELRISKIYVDGGPTAKRSDTRARGRGNRILKRTCHITVMVADE